MAEYGIPVIDLYGFTRNLGSDVYCDRGVHLNEQAAAEQAAFIAGALWSRRAAGVHPNSERF